MEFDKSRVFSSVNADELRAGDKVIVGNCVKQLKSRIESNIVEEIKQLFGEQEPARFDVGEDKLYALAYLVERAENCTNCQDHEYCGFVQNQSRFANLNRCENWKPKTEQKAEKHYRPFRDTDELIKVWDSKRDTYPAHLEGLEMPLIWVQDKETGKRFALAELDERILGYLFDHCTFLDGSPCGVEE